MKNDMDDSKDKATDRTGNHKRLYSTHGTPDYIAIEVLYQKGIYTILRLVLCVYDMIDLLLIHVHRL